jgi:hypothetical protein
VSIGDRLAAQLLQLPGYLFGGAFVGALAADGATNVVHNDPSAARRQAEDVLPAQPPAGARYYRYLPIKPKFSHAVDDTGRPSPRACSGRKGLRQDAKGSGPGLSVRFSSRFVAAVVVMLDPVPAFIHVDVGYDLAVL